MLSVGQHWPLKQRPEQQLLFAAQELPLAEQTQVPLEQTPEQQSLLLAHPKSLLAIQATQVDVVVSQTSPEQQSLVVAQPESPLGIQLTQVMVVVSQFREQQSRSLAQEPAFAIQHVPLLQVWADEHVETQAPAVELQVRHWLESHGAVRQVEPQTFSLSQHPPLRQVWPEAQQMPLQHRPGEQQVFTVQLPPAAVHGVTHWPFWQFWPEAQQCAPV
jgi:hypothetical protein